MYHSDWSKVSTKQKVSSSLACLQMLVMKHFNTHNVRSKTKLSDNRFYMHCVKQYLLCANQWLRSCFHSSCTWMKASKALTMNMSFSGVEFHGTFHFQFFFSPAAPDLELILFPLWYWPIMNAYTKQQQDKMFKTDFIDSRKSDPPFAQLLSLSHILYGISVIMDTNYYMVLYLCTYFCHQQDFLLYSRQEPWQSLCLHCPQYY